MFPQREGLYPICFFSRAVDVVNIILLVKPGMIKEKTSELAGRKGVRLVPKGGSIPEVIKARICRSVTELNPYFLPFSPFT